jgi:hypothetical protein
MTESARIPMRGRDGNVTAWALVDAEDLERLNAMGGWSLNGKGYAALSSPASMHRAVLGIVTKGAGGLVDHASRDTLDNRKSNLRMVNRSQNGQNRHPKPGRGVGRRADGKFRARVVVDGREIGQSCATYDEAARVAATLRAAHMPYSPEAAA